MMNDVRSDTLKVSCLGFPVSAEKVLSLGIENTTVKNGHDQTQQLSVLGLESCANRTEIQHHLAKRWHKLKKEFEFIARYAAKDRLVEAITIFSEARKSRFLRRRTPKYGALNKGFNEEELQRFFKVIDDQRMHLLFSYQAILGLRIGEAVRIQIKDINLKTRELKIETEKAKTLDLLFIPEQLFDATLKYIKNFEVQIVKAGGYLFFVENRRISISYARSAFYRYIQKSKLYEVYGYSNDARPRTLTRLTTHSLRHFAITNHAKKNNGNVVLSNKFARHRRLQTTMTYIYTSKDELYRSIERAQDTELLDRIRKMQGIL